MTLPQYKAPFGAENACLKIVLFLITHFTATTAKVNQDAYRVTWKESREEKLLLKSASRDSNFYLVTVTGHKPAILSP